MSAETDNYTKLSTFFSDEYRSLRAYAKSRIDDTTDRDADDIIQDVAVNVFSRANSALPIENIAAFVYRSVRNRIVDIMRSGKKERAMEEESEKNLLQLGEELYRDTEQTYTDELTKRLKAEIENLKQPYREIIIAIDFEGYSYKEISLETGIPLGTLMSRRHRALSLLLKALESKKEKYTKI
ncbi:RNA polymerase sigma factor [Euzebyella saccharophila]|uniref:RNA polymerase sigma factor n=1 Tax=Euzebyella saccharophila TaxID=679664 RepID=A0ABV8JMD4_9FLAO|nr:RNA polymerase sigma factor [Euzebyella saccharophila]